MANAIIAEFEKQSSSPALTARRLHTAPKHKSKSEVSASKSTAADTEACNSLEDLDTDPIVPLETVSKKLSIEKSQAIVLAKSLGVDHQNMKASEADLMIQLWHEQQLALQMKTAVANVEQTRSAVATEAIRQAAHEGYDLAQTTEIVRQQSFLYGLVDSSQQTLALFGKLHRSQQDAIRQELKNCREGLQSTEAGNPTQAVALQQMTVKREHFQKTDNRRLELIKTTRFNWTQ